MLTRLEQLVDEIGALHSKLVLLSGTPQAGKTALLLALAKNRGVSPLNIGSTLGSRLAVIPQRQFRSDVFPEPEGPVTARHWPASAAKLTRSRSRRPGTSNVTSIASNRITVVLRSSGSDG